MYQDRKAAPAVSKVVSEVVSEVVSQAANEGMNEVAAQAVDGAVDQTWQDSKKVASAEQDLESGKKPKGKAHGQTGPKTLRGKNKSRWNAMVDGATAKSSVLPFEDERIYRAHIKAVEQALCPANYIEQQMVREYAEGLWRIIRHEKRGAYEREAILDRLTPAMAAQFLNLEDDYVRCAPQWLIDPQHRVSRQEQQWAKDALAQYQHLMKNAKGIANFNMVWRQYSLLFPLVAEWLKTKYPNFTPLMMSSGKDISLAWQQNPQKLLEVIEEFANQTYFVAHYEHFKPKVRVWMESWYFLQRAELHRLERSEQLLLKERNYTASILERLMRFRKSNVYIDSVPANVKTAFAKNEMTESRLKSVA
ncbi:hypothetical protein G6720_01820 [Polynucleobacter paneuropaeus]|nr:hypothetical protein G6720_01820 [Polynucleobacter paneuropaeus]